MAAGATRSPPRGKLSDPVQPWCAVASRSAVGGVQDPPVQPKCTTVRSNRTDPARLGLPEDTFTIRAWSRQTVLPLSGAAPDGVTATDISASPPEVCWPGSLVTPDQSEVCPLSRGVMLQPLSAPLQCPSGEPRGKWTTSRAGTQLPARLVGDRRFEETI